MDAADWVARVVETEVTEKAKRRGFTAEYKRRILTEIERSTVRGAVGALLRREGLYSSHVAAWRLQLEAGDLGAFEPKKRGPKPWVNPESVRKIALLERQIARTETCIKHAESLLQP